MSQSNLAHMNKFPSVSSIHSMVSLGYLPPGHGYIPRKQKPDKPYGPSFITIMNRTWRGPGRKYLRYALIIACIDLLFYISAALYFAHRNVSRMITKHSEPTGACLLIIAIGLTAFTFHLIAKARLESNRWRSYTRFRADGLFHVAPHNEHYHPEDMAEELDTGTYGPRAVKEIPKPRHMRGRSKPGSRPGGRIKGNAMTTLMEDDEAPLVDEMGSQDFLDMIPPQFNGNQPEPQRFDDSPLPEVHRPQAQRPGGPGQPYHPPMEQSVPLDRRTPDPYGMHDTGPPRVRMTPEPRYMGQEKMPPQARMTPEPRYMAQEKMPPHVRMTPEPRIMGQERMPPQARMTPEPRYMAQERMPPQARMTPEPRYMQHGRITPQQHIVPIDRMPQPRATPDPRPPVAMTPEPPAAGRDTPDPKASEPRLAPPPSRAPAGAFKTPEPRMAPGQAKLATPQARMVPGQGRPPAGPGRATPR